MSTPRARALRSRVAIDPDAPDTPPPPPSSAPPPAPTVQPEVEVPADEPTVEPAPLDPPAAPVPAPRRRAARPKKAAAVPESPAADPAEERKDYRSFYVRDSAFVPFRDAFYWLARNPEVIAEHGDNMSVALEQWMTTVAADLQRRFNNGERFPPKPGSTRR